MTTHEINLLIERYLDGETTPAEERELALAVQREDRPAEWAIIAEMLGELTQDEELYDSIMTQREPEPAVQVAATAPRLVKLWPWAAAACVALAVGLSIKYTRHDTPQEVAQEIAHVKQIIQPQVDKQVMPPPAEAPHAVAAPAKAPLAAPTQVSLAIVDETLLPDSVNLASVEPKEVPNETPEEVPDAAPDTNLYLALLAEVEARVLQAEQSEQLLYQSLLDELLANIQQQSNRPELSL